MHKDNKAWLAVSIPNTARDCSQVGDRFEEPQDMDGDLLYAWEGGPIRCHGGAADGDQYR